jgi:hypothetical protein
MRRRAPRGTSAPGAPPQQEALGWVGLRALGTGGGDGPAAGPPRRQQLVHRGGRPPPSSGRGDPNLISCRSSSQLVSRISGAAAPTGPRPVTVRKGSRNSATCCARSNRRPRPRSRSRLQLSSAVPRHDTSPARTQPVPARRLVGICRDSVRLARATIALRATTPCRAPRPTVGGRPRNGRRRNPWTVSWRGCGCHRLGRARRKRGRIPPGRGAERRAIPVRRALDLRRPLCPRAAP